MDYISNDHYGISEKDTFAALKKSLHPGLFGKFKKGISKDKARATTALSLHDYNDIPNLDFLRYFPELDHLAVRSETLNNLGGLQHCPKLTNLELTSNWPAEVDLSPLKHCPKLTGLVLEQVYGRPDKLNANVKLYRTETLAILKGLEFLSIPQMGLRDIAWIKSLAKLNDLELAGNPLEDLAPLKELQLLQEIDLTDCGIKNISALSNLPELEIVYLDKNMISDFGPLLNLKKLRELSAADNGLTAPEIAKWRETFSHIEEAYFSDEDA